jgi:hypothetical protein
MELWEAMDKSEWMNVWDTLDAERHEQTRLDAIWHGRK